MATKTQRKQSKNDYIAANQYRYNNQIFELSSFTQVASRAGLTHDAIVNHVDYTESFFVAAARTPLSPVSAYLSNRLYPIIRRLGETAESVVPVAHEFPLFPGMPFQPMSYSWNRPPILTPGQESLYSAMQGYRMFDTLFGEKDLCLSAVRMWDLLENQHSTADVRHNIAQTYFVLPKNARDPNDNNKYIISIPNMPSVYPLNTALDHNKTKELEWRASDYARAMASGKIRTPWNLFCNEVAEIAQWCEKTLAAKNEALLALVILYMVVGATHTVNQVCKILPGLESFLNVLDSLNYEEDCDTVYDYDERRDMEKSGNPYPTLGHAAAEDVTTECRHNITFIRSLLLRKFPAMLERWIETRGSLNRLLLNVDRIGVPAHTAVNDFTMTD